MDRPHHPSNQQANAQAPAFAIGSNDNETFFVEPLHEYRERYTDLDPDCPEPGPICLAPLAHRTGFLINPASKAAQRLCTETSGDSDASPGNVEAWLPDAAQYDRGLRLALAQFAHKEKALSADCRRWLQEMA